MLRVELRSERVINQAFHILPHQPFFLPKPTHKADIETVDNWQYLPHDKRYFH